MSGLLLSDMERRRFVDYLATEIASTRGIIEQMEKIRTPEVLVRQFKVELQAFLIIHNKLDKTEALTLGERDAHR